MDHHRPKDRGRSRSRSPERRHRSTSRERHVDRERDREGSNRKPHQDSGKDRSHRDRDYHHHDDKRARDTGRSRRRSYSRSRSRSRSPRRQRPRSRSRSRSRSPDRKRRRRSRSRDSDSDSESDRERSSRKKKDKKKKRRSSASRERKEQRKREKKEKKKLKKSAAHASSHWGKYGVITEQDIFTKAAEFHAWLIEERKINPETVSKDQSKKEFSQFVEDFNTATFPHEKYYSIATYDRRMSALRSGETLPPSEDLYDPNADLRALQSSQSRAKKSTENSGDALLDRERLTELRKVMNERAEVGRMKVLGMDIKTNFGVRMDGNEFED